MKITKTLTVVLIALTSCFNTTAQKKWTEKSLQDKWFSFTWYGDSVSGRYYDKLAMVIPVTIQGLKGNFTMQFDLGSNSSDLYGNVLKNYFHGQLPYARLDTTVKSISDANHVSYKTKDFTVKAGRETLANLYYLVGFGDEIPVDSLYTRSEKLVGTVGANFTTNKVLIIDYPNKRMALLDSLSDAVATRTTFVDCRVKKGRIHIPLNINGQQSWILFDTGASLFPLMSDYGLWSTLVDTTAKRDTMMVSSWGEQVPYYGAAIRYPVYLGNAALSKGHAWYTENKRLLNFNKDERVAGTTGNAFFFNDIVVLDFRNKKFGILNK